MFSKNAASSRAIPIEKMIQQVIDNPAMPEFWGENQSGMQAVKELSDEKTITICLTPENKLSESETISPKEAAKRVWLNARNSAINYVQSLSRLNVHKQISNRILEPWFHIRIICSATEYENFFALRAHKDAQPEIQVLAYKMLEEYNKSTPRKLINGDWHIPFGDKIDVQKLITCYARNESDKLLRGEKVDSLQDLKIKIAIARCARISYFNYEGKDDYEADVKLCDRLFGNNPKHLSPTEHVAMATDDSNFIGNFKGFKQYRYFFNDQNLPDPRVTKKI
jgi:thymidylate synthase ThyX